MAYCCIKQHPNADGQTWCSECASLVVGALIDDYQIVSYLGAGSTSIVYLARQHSLNNRKVVIKVLYASWSRSDLAHFRKEAALLASLSHPYILPIHAYGVIREERKAAHTYTPYLALPYVEQGSLDTAFTREGGKPWALERVVTLTKEAADALDYAHSRGVLHRDIKLANLLLSGSHIVLCDFGVSAFIDPEISHLDAPCAGTPAYMAPEVWDCRPGRYSDQYALAITCYRLLTAQHPLVQGDAAKPQNWSYLHRQVAPRSLQESRSDLPLVVNLVFERALAKDPHDRYPDIQAFASDLQAASLDITAVPRDVPRSPKKAPDPGNGHPISQPGIPKDAPQLPDNLPTLPLTPPTPQTGRAQMQNNPSAARRAEEAAAQVPPAGRIPREAAQMQNNPPAARRAEEAVVPQSLSSSISISGSRRSSMWTLMAFVLNLLICIVVIFEAIWTLGGINLAQNLAAVLWPSLLIGPLLAVVFRRIPLDSLPWGILWGLLFGITDVLLSGLVCYGLAALAQTIPHWGHDWLYPGDGPRIFLQQVRNLFPRALVLTLLAVWIAAPGGSVIGFLSALQAQRNRRS